MSCKSNLFFQHSGILISHLKAHPAFGIFLLLHSFAVSLVIYLYVLVNGEGVWVVTVASSADTIPLTSPIKYTFKVLITHNTTSTFEKHQKL